jgi:mannose-6-phosphate isomerase-like protein (cupin superfamily)
MSDWTHKNLRDVADVAEGAGFGHIMEARFGHGDLDCTQAGFAYQHVKPGQRQGFAHRHDNAEEVYVVIGGAGHMKLDDETIDLQRLDAVRVSPNVVRAMAAGDDGLEILVFGARHEGDGEILRDKDPWE